MDSEALLAISTSGVGVKVKVGVLVGVKVLVGVLVGVKVKVFVPV
jgi:hypothetical protein